MTCKLLLKDNLQKTIEKNETKNLCVLFAYTQQSGGTKTNVKKEKGLGK